MLPAPRIARFTRSHGVHGSRAFVPSCTGPSHLVEASASRAPRRLNLFDQGCALLRPFEMVKCDRCSETAAPNCLMEPKQCGKCCWPRCGEGAHSQRHSARGKRGRISKEQRWNNVWRLAHKSAVHMWQNVPLRRFMKESGERFGSIRYQLMRSIHQTLRDCPSDESRNYHRGRCCYAVARTRRVGGTHQGIFWGGRCAAFTASDGYDT